MAEREIVWDVDAPLERCSGESRKSNAALRDYALMGDGRSVRALQKRYAAQVTGGGQASSPPTKQLTTLFTWSARYDWVARVRRFDQLSQEAALREFQRRRVADREVRIKALEGWRSMLIKAMSSVNPASASFSDVTHGLRMVTEELRREYGEVDQVVEVRGGAERAASPAASMSDAEVAAAVQNLLVGGVAAALGLAGGDADGGDDAE